MPSLAEVARHRTETDLWVAIDGRAYDLTRFAGLHPGGKRVLLQHAGQDATRVFRAAHAPGVLERYAARMDLDRGPVETKGKDEAFVYAEPYWYSGLPSPHYGPELEAWRDKVRAFVASWERKVDQWDEEGTYPPELHRQAYDAGLYGAIWPEQYGGTPPDEGFSAFHDLVLIDELARCGGGGILWALFYSQNVALPPLLSGGSPSIRDRIAPLVVRGEKIMSLAITEPYAGSDVAQIQTTATLSDDGTHYIVSGEKKFISSGTKADYFTTAVRTGGSSTGGISLLLIDRSLAGVSVRRLKTQGWWTSGTAFIVFDRVHVPVDYLIGAENEGFKRIMHNFNHERFAMAAMCNRWSRVCIEDAVQYARDRTTFNRPLSQHQVIRHKVALMSRHVTANHAWLEQIAYQMDHGASDRQLGGPIALLKVQCTQTMELCTREAQQIMGGVGCLRSGPGQRVERLTREVRINAVAGGSEEILQDLAMRQAKL